MKFNISFSKNSAKNQATPRCIERPPHQRSAPDNFPTCQKHFIEHLACTVSGNIQKSSEFQCFSFSRQCRFHQKPSTISPVATLDRCSLLPLLIQCTARSFGRAQVLVATWHLITGVFCGGRTTRGGQQGSALPFGAVQHRPSHQKPPRGCPLACACCSTLAVA